MTGSAVRRGHGTDRPCPGRLVYVIGPSGAGKDTILRHVETQLPLDAGIVIARRYITRPPDRDGEHHIPVSRAAFDDLRRSDGFSMSWESHGLGYGIGRDILGCLASGLTVVVNGSREHLPVVRRDFGERLLTVLVTASRETLAARLSQRNRETEREIAARLERAELLQRDLVADVIIRNDGDLSTAVEEFMHMLAEKVQPCA